MSDNCKVVFFGELLPGFDKEQVIASFSGNFGVSPEKASKLINTSNDVVLKGGLDEQRANKYSAVLKKIGMVVRIDGLESASSISGLSLEPIEEASATNPPPAPPEATAAADDDATLVMDPSQVVSSISACPKCGSTNVHEGECRDCGIIISKYLASQTQSGDDEESWQAKSDNPYSAPEADLVDSMEGEMTGPQGVPAGHAMGWIGQGWGHFKQNPFAWIFSLVLWIVIAMVLSMVPFIGSIIVNLLTPVITAGFMLGCKAQDEGEDFTLSHLFAGFSANAGQLVLAGVIYFAIVMLLTIAMMAGFFSMIDMEQMMETQDPETMTTMMTSPGMLIGILLALLFMIPVAMAYIYAPALISLNNLNAIEAMKLSFSGCLKNILPWLLYGILAFILLIVASIPFGLGLLIVLPMLTASLYASYKDVYYS